MDKDLRKETRALFNEVAAHEKALRQLKTRPLDQAYISKALLLRDAGERMLFLNFEYASGKNLDVLIWQRCFHKIIEEYRQQIRKLNAKIDKLSASITEGSDRSAEKPKELETLSATLTQKCNLFSKFISDSSAFYDHLLGRYKSTFDVDITTHVVRGAVTPEQEKYYLACHRVLVYLGDLARYRDQTLRDGDKTFEEASKWYNNAARLIGSIGTPHNQLAVLATLRKTNLGALYRYYRSLALDQPFVTSRENLVTFFEKNRIAVSALGPAKVIKLPGGGKQKVNSGTGKRVQTSILERCHLNYIRLHGIVFTRVDVEEFDQVKKYFMTNLAKLLKAPQSDLTSEHAWWMVSSLLYLIHHIDAPSPTASSAGDSTGKGTATSTMSSGHSETFAHVSQTAPLKRLTRRLLLDFATVMLVHSQSILRHTLQGTSPVANDEILFLPALATLSEFILLHAAVLLKSDDELPACQQFVKELSSFLTLVLQDAARCEPLDPALLSSPWLRPPESLELLDFTPLASAQGAITAGMGSGRRPEFLNQVDPARMSMIHHRRRLVSILDLGIGLCSPIDGKTWMKHENGVFVSLDDPSAYQQVSKSMGAPVAQSAHTAPAAPRPAATDSAAATWAGPATNAGGSVAHQPSPTAAFPTAHAAGDWAPPFPTSLPQPGDAQPPGVSPWTSTEAPSLVGSGAGASATGAYNTAQGTSGSIATPSDVYYTQQGSVPTWSVNPSSQATSTYSLFSFPQQQPQQQQQGQGQQQPSGQSGVTPWQEQSVPTTAIPPAATTSPGHDDSAVIDDLAQRFNVDTILDSPAHHSSSSGPVADESATASLLANAGESGAVQSAPARGPGPAVNGGQAGMFDWLTGGSNAQHEWEELEPG